MYTPPSSQKKQALKQALIYTLMTSAVVAIVFLLVLFTLGYRFNRTAGTIEQGGLLQLGSMPSGANVTINATRLSATTSTKTMIAPGQHAITMEKKGYHAWQKTIEMKRGSIVWLNHARLVPTDLPVSHIASLAGATSAEPSPSRKWYALTTDDRTPAVTLVDISADTPKTSVLTLPEGSYTPPEVEGAETFRIDAWDASSRYLLLRHTYAETIEWIIVDTEDVTKSKNITTIFDVAMTHVQFSPANSQVLYALIGGDVRKIDIEASTVSAPLVRGVAEFSIFDKSTIVYATTVDSVTRSRSVGYRNDNADAPRAIRTYSDDGLVPLHITIDKYYNQTYVAIAYGNAVEILSGLLPRSDSDDALSLKATATMSTPGPISFFSSKTDGRFFVAQHGNSYSVYDLEWQKATTTALQGDGEQTRELRWLDSYRVTSDLGGTLRMYEFDGANQHDIMPIVAGQYPALTANGRFLYAPTVDEHGAFHLSRVRLILP